MKRAMPEDQRRATLTMLESGVQWLGMLGELRKAVLAGDQALARKLAERPITYPQEAQR